MVRVMESMCDNYVSPNWLCSVVVSSDEQKIMLLGGAPRSNKPKRYVYTAAIADVLHNTKAGWIRVKTPWPLGNCMMWGGYDVANITIHT